MDIFWDYDTCPVPEDVDVTLLLKNILDNCHTLCGNKSTRSQRVISQFPIQNDILSSKYELVSGHGSVFFVSQILLHLWDVDKNSTRTKEDYLIVISKTNLYDSFFDDIAKRGVNSIWIPNFQSTSAMMYNSSNAVFMRPLQWSHASSRLVQIEAGHFDNTYDINYDDQRSDPRSFYYKPDSYGNNQGKQLDVLNDFMLDMTEEDLTPPKDSFNNRSNATLSNSEHSMNTYRDDSTAIPKNSSHSHSSQEDDDSKYPYNINSGFASSILSSSNHNSAHNFGDMSSSPVRPPPGLGMGMGVSDWMTERNTMSNVGGGGSLDFNNNASFGGTLGNASRGPYGSSWRIEEPNNDGLLWDQKSFCEELMLSLYQFNVKTTVSGLRKIYTKQNKNFRIPNILGIVIPDVFRTTTDPSLANQELITKCVCFLLECIQWCFGIQKGENIESFKYKMNKNIAKWLLKECAKKAFQSNQSAAIISSTTSIAYQILNITIELDFALELLNAMNVPNPGAKLNPYVTAWRASTNVGVVSLVNDFVKDHPELYSSGSQGGQTSALLNAQLMSLPNSFASLPPIPEFDRHDLAGYEGGMGGTGDSSLLHRGGLLATMSSLGSEVTHSSYGNTNHSRSSSVDGTPNSSIFNSFSSSELDTMSNLSNSSVITSRGVYDRKDDKASLSINGNSNNFPSSSPNMTARQTISLNAMQDELSIEYKLLRLLSRSPRGELGARIPALYRDEYGEPLRLRGRKMKDILLDSGKVEMVGVDGPGDKLFRFIFNTPGNPNTVQLQQPPMSPISASHGLAMGSLGHARGRGMSNSLSVPSFASDTNKSGTGTVTAMTNSYFYNDYSRSMSLSDSNLNATASLNNSRGTLNDEEFGYSFNMNSPISDNLVTSLLSNTMSNNNSNTNNSITTNNNSASNSTGNSNGNKLNGFDRILPPPHLHQQR